MKLVLTSRIQTAGRWLLAVVLLWAAVSKLAEPTDFLSSVYAYKLPLPRVLLQVVAVVLPWVELLCGLALVANVWRESALLLATGMFGVFILATGQAWARGLDISCGCLKLTPFGVPDAAGGELAFYESAAFAFFRAIVLAGVGWLLLREQLAPKP
jgi:uncharacterized membrane protein YphA (DoxX/SURF4 family)